MTFEQSVEIAAPAADLFALTQDYGRRLEWDPFLRSAELVGGATAPGVGVRAYCVARSGLGMETEYVSYNPPRVAAVRMTRGPWMIGLFAGSWRFTEMSPGKTRVGFRYGLRARPRCLSWAFTPVLVWVFACDTRRRLAALRAAVESGRLSGSQRPGPAGPVFGQSPVGPVGQGVQPARFFIRLDPGVPLGLGSLGPRGQPLPHLGDLGGWKFGNGGSD
ncbi:MAG: type II toxin-antitoxin system RatA family toxin [Fimbriiglobus sp.]